MDPNFAWDTMLTAYATKQWAEALDHAEALRDWLEGGGFPPRLTIGSSTGQFTCQPDGNLSRSLALAGCHEIFEQSLLQLGDIG